MRKLYPRVRQAVPDMLFGLSMVTCGGLLAVGIVGGSWALNQLGVHRVAALAIALILSGLVFSMFFPVVMRYAVRNRAAAWTGSALMGGTREMITIDTARQAVTALEELLVVSFDASAMSKLSPVQRAGIRGGVIQHYVTAYELCYVLIEQWVRRRHSAEELEGVLHSQMLMLAASGQLIRNIGRWTTNAAERLRVNSAVNWDDDYHSIDERATRVHAIGPGFIEDARDMLVALEAFERVGGDGEAA